MSKSLNRVKRALAAHGLPAEIREVGQARTAADAAAAVNCQVNQIAKSIIFRGMQSDTALLFLTAGANQVCAEKAGAIAGEPLGKADAGFVRAQTGFAIGGVAPIGHLTPPMVWFDTTLSGFATVWAAAGTPRHVFALAPNDLLRITSAQVADFIKQ